VFSLFGEHPLISNIRQQLHLPAGELILRKFPDTEFFLKIKSNVKNQRIIIIDSLDKPNQKILALLFFINTARELGAVNIGLIAPYLSYMRQDTRFSAGEAITSDYFAKLLSQSLDWLITVDPHLHRHKELQEIYSIPTKVVHATANIVDWLKQNVKNPLLIGPDEESQQWVAAIAQAVDAPYIVLKKVRHSDTDVEISTPDLHAYKKHCPVLIDDIISTARTMVAAVKHLHDANMQAPICIGVHAIFAGDSYKELQRAGAQQIVTCNTIVHPSNGIDLSKIIAQEHVDFLAHKLY